MNTTDLRNLLAERATLRPESTADARVTGALARATSIRRTRIGAGLIGAAATLAVIGALTSITPTVSSRDDVEPATPPAEDAEAALPTQHHDLRLIGSASLEPPADRVSVTVTPTAPVMLSIITACEHDEPLRDAPLIELSIENAVFSNGYCGGTLSRNTAGWEELGVQADQPVTIDLKVTANPGPVAFGVYEPGVYSD